MRTVALYNLLDIKLKKTTEKPNYLIEKRLGALENFIVYINDYKKISKDFSKEEIIDLLSLNFFSHASKFLSPKNQLAEKYDLLEELEREEEAEKVYKEYKKEVAFLKERKEKEKKEKELLKSQKTPSTGKIVKQLMEFEKNEKEELEKSMENSRKFVEQNKRSKPKKLESQVNSSEISAIFNPQEDKFIIPVIKEKPKKKGEIDQNRLQEKERKITKKPVEIRNNQEPKQEEENSKESAYSKKAEEKLSGTAKDILDALFAPYYGKTRKGGKIRWKQLEISKKEIETLLESAGFDFETEDGSHFKIYRKGEKNHLDSVPVHDGFIKTIYEPIAELFFRVGSKPA